MCGFRNTAVLTPVELDVRSIRAGQSTAKKSCQAMIFLRFVSINFCFYMFFIFLYAAYKFFLTSRIKKKFAVMFFYHQKNNRDLKKEKNFCHKGVILPWALAIFVRCLQFCMRGNSAMERTGLSGLWEDQRKRDSA